MVYGNHLPYAITLSYPLGFVKRGMRDCLLFCGQVKRDLKGNLLPPGGGTPVYFLRLMTAEPMGHGFDLPLVFLKGNQGFVFSDLSEGYFISGLGLS